MGGVGVQMGDRVTIGVKMKSGMRSKLGLVMLGLRSMENPTEPLCWSRSCHRGWSCGWGQGLDRG